MLKQKNRGHAFLDRVSLLGEPSPETVAWTKMISFTLYLEQRSAGPRENPHINLANILHHGKILDRLVTPQLYVGGIVAAQQVRGWRIAAQYTK